MIGTIVDGLLRYSGLLIYESAVPVIHWLAPVWIIAMWMLFSTTLNHSLSWLKGRPWLSFLLGAIFGPLSYIAGTRLEAIAFNGDWWTIVGMLAIVWGASMMLLMLLEERNA